MRTEISSIVGLRHRFLLAEYIAMLNFTWPDGVRSFMYSLPIQTYCDPNRFFAELNTLRVSFELPLCYHSLTRYFQGMRLEQ